MRIFKPIYRHYLDKKRINFENRETSNWYLEFKDHLEIVRRLPAFTDKKLSEELGRKIEKLVVCRTLKHPPDLELSLWLETLTVKLRNRLSRIGLIESQRLAASQPLAEHLADFKTTLKSRGITGYHVEQKISRLKRIFTGCGFTYWSDISAARIETFLANLRTAKPKDTDTEANEDTVKTLGVQTTNYYLGAVKHFARWMIQERRASESPVAHLRKLNAEMDKQHRRALTLEELRNLLGKTINGEKCYGVVGVDRYMLYKMAVETGLRSNELRNLTRLSFILDSDRPEVRLPARFSKHRKNDVLPLRPDTAAELKSYLSLKMPTAPAFAMPSPSNVVRMFRMDLEAAGIVEKDTPCPDLAFHSLRHTFVTNLSRGGVDPRTAQELARHSKIDLTMNVYTHKYQGELADAVTALPDLSRPELEKNKNIATGTDGAVELPGHLPSHLPFLGGKQRTSPDFDGQNGGKVSEIESAQKTPQNAENRPTAAVNVGEIEMGRGGIEPPTQGFSVLCSTN